MAALRPGGADAPGPVTPEGDDARELGGGAGIDVGQLIADNRHFAGGQGRLLELVRSRTKRTIVIAACWGFPAAWAQWLIERGGLRDA